MEGLIMKKAIIKQRTKKMMMGITTDCSPIVVKPKNNAIIA